MAPVTIPTSTFAIVSKECTFGCLIISLRRLTSFLSRTAFVHLPFTVSPLIVFVSLNISSGFFCKKSKPLTPLIPTPCDAQSRLIFFSTNRMTAPCKVSLNHISFGSIITILEQCSPKNVLKDCACITFIISDGITMPRRPPGLRSETPDKIKGTHAFVCLVNFKSSNLKIASVFSWKSFSKN
ncbi:Uncharacterised protein [Klebsiella pneumoniae]|nr:Uncharacterised protein [Klebsiella pneumoniae]SXT04103.1 Uncharacterised protein [Klebsiella pneumoniae]